MRRSIIQALLLLSVFLLVGCKGGASSDLPSTATQTQAPTIQPSPAVTPAPGALMVNDTTVADKLSFAFIQANDVWVSRYGAPPQQVTHLGLEAQQPGWFLLWSPDQTKLLADASSNPAAGTPTSEAWVISLPGNTVQPLPSSSVAASCADHNCAWLGDRYLVHQNLTRQASHYFHFQVYDTQAQRDLLTSLDDQAITPWQVRGSSIYFTPYDTAPTSIPGTIKRFDFSSNQITTLFTVSGPLVDQGIPSGSWDLSADASKVVVDFSVGASSHCPIAACYTFYQDRGGTIALIFPSYQSRNGSGPELFDDAVIAPDGKAAANLISGASNIFQLAQQSLPHGNELLNALSAASADQNYAIVGWTAQPAGILVQQLPTGAGIPPVTTSAYFVPLGAAGTAQLIETIGAGLVIFAPPMA